MPTVASWTEATLRAVVDVGHLLRFRAGTVRRRGAGAGAVAGFGLVTAAFAVVPAHLPDAGSGDGWALDLLLLLPTALATFLLVAVLSAVASGGGREILARDHAAVHPISPTTDHLGALLLAPLNVAWLLQVWTLLGSTAYALGTRGLAAAQLVVLAWILAATALGQVFAWALEAVRRETHGPGLVRLLALVGLLAAVTTQLTGNVGAALDRVPTLWVVIGMVDGFGWRWAGTLAAVLGLGLAATVLGALPAHLAARRTPRDEQRLETAHRTPRPAPRTVLGGLLRTDRASVWRAVPMRRGLTVLAVAPGLVALAGGLPWSSLTVLPGLVASGASLLFGVNAWCLDGRGGLWRESLPVPPGLVFAARTWVLVEFLFAASMVTLVLGALRAGRPTATELAALTATVLVVAVQVAGAAMRWSAQRPYAVDLRSARATPAPPVVMVGYSARLAVSTTLTGVLFSVLSRASEPALPVLAAVPFLCWSLVRLDRVARRWLAPADRARVVTAVAA